MTCNEKGAVREKRGAWDPGRNNKIHTHIKKKKKKRVKCKISSGITLHPRG